MREILFRGKRIDNGEWVEGDFLAPVFEGIPWILPRGEGEEVKVDPSTVGQYTGLCDKNGKKAFSHDITKDFWGRVWVIFDCPGGFGICTRDEWTENNGEVYTALSDHQNSEWFKENHAIIGHIHDNPELLEVSHE